MKIKVLRDYSGAEGVGVDKDVAAGSEHIVTRARAAELKAVGLVEVIGEDEHPDDEFRGDGPTVGEYVAAGYQATNYPPQGYASRSTDEEIAAAIAAQRGDVKEEPKPIQNKAARPPRNKAATQAADKGANGATPKAE